MEDEQETSNRSSPLTRYFAEIRGFPQLTKEKEQELAFDGSNPSPNELVEANLSFVTKVASEYRNLGLPFEDVINEGNVGLIEAAHRYSAVKGTKFITYAIWWIRKSILKALSENSGMVRVPRYQMNKVREIRDQESTLSKELGRKPDREEISDRVDKSLAKVDQVLQFATRDMSLDDRVGRDRETPISDYLVDDHTPGPDEELLRTESQALVTDAMGHLSDQERVVICYRFGVGGDPQLTLKEIGEMMSISRERVRQIENQAKERLLKVVNERHMIGRNGGRIGGNGGGTQGDNDSVIVPIDALSVEYALRKPRQYKRELEDYLTIALDLGTIKPENRSELIPRCVYLRVDDVAGRNIVIDHDQKWVLDLNARKVGLVAAFYQVVRSGAAPRQAEFIKEVGLSLDFFTPLYDACVLSGK